jgi:hypothetical protein
MYLKAVSAVGCWLGSTHFTRTCLLWVPCYSEHGRTLRLSAYFVFYFICLLEVAATVECS